MTDLVQLCEEIYYLISSIKDPERPGTTLSQLDVIHQNRVVCITQQDLTVARVYIKPTNPSCHLVHQIALSIHCKLQQQLASFSEIKLELLLEPDSHVDVGGVQKQINDKERVNAALQTPEIHKFIHSLISYE